MVAQDLKLDPSIRDWVVLPLMFMAVMVSIFSRSLQNLFKSTPKPKLDEYGYRQMLGRSNRVRSNSKWISAPAFSMRKAYLGDPEKGLLHQKELPGPTNPMTDPSAMMGSMTGNLKFFVNSMMVEVFVNYFFQGLVMLRMPFALFNGFKMMNQRGVDLTTLDPSFVSSMSWYFLVMFGGLQIVNLFRGDNSEEARLARQAQMLQAQMGSQMNFDATKMFAAEAKVIDLAVHKDGLEDVEKRLLGRKYPKPSLLKMSSSMAATSSSSSSSSSSGGAKLAKVKARKQSAS